MDALSIKKIDEDLLEKYKVRPLKRLGQNFLINQITLKKIIESAGLNPVRDYKAKERTQEEQISNRVNQEDIVIEIGPGLGILTKELAKRTKRVVAVEKDPRMCKILKETLKDFKNVEIIQEDILKSQKLEVKTQKYKVVANLPYYITSPVIRKFLELKNPPKLMVLMVQKEVAQRICACPPRMNILAVSVQFYGKPEIISPVSKKSFWPQPKVDSAIIKIVPRQFPASVPRQFRERFFRIARAGFSSPRKQIINNLSHKLKLDKEKVKSWLLKNKIEPTQRAETLTLKNWRALANTFKN